MLNHRDLELKNFNLESGNVSHIDREKLEAFFRKYNFHSLINRMNKVFGKVGNSERDEKEEELWEDLEDAKKTTLSCVHHQKDTKEQISMF